MPTPPVLATVPLRPTPSVDYPEPETARAFYRQIDLAQVLAVGHEFQIDSDVGPPLAFWFAEIAFSVAGMLGVYLLAQACVVLTYWCVYELGRAIVGPRHAVVQAIAEHPAEAWAEQGFRRFPTS